VAAVSSAVYQYIDSSTASVTRCHYCSIDLSAFSPDAVMRSSVLLLPLMTTVMRYHSVANQYVAYIGENLIRGCIKADVIG